jgi:hypothetical protein
VNIWMTPPIASAPYRLDAGPRRISMRSICASGIASSEVVPALDDATRMPSISTSVCALLAPRKKTPETAPGPPFWMTLDPGLMSEKLGEALRAGTLDFIAADDRDVGQYVGDRLRLARRGDRNGLESRGFRWRDVLRHCRPR